MNIEDIINYESFIADLEEGYLEGWNHSFVENGFEISYDCGQLIQLEDSSYNPSVSYIEVEITQLEPLEKWSILVIINNYHGSMGPDLIAGIIEDPLEVELIMIQDSELGEEEEED